MSHEKTWTWLRKRSLKKETEFLLIAAQNNAIRTNYVKAITDKTQENSRCRLCSDRNETINHIISEYSKLAQKEYKIRHDWDEKVIVWKLCKKFNFYHTYKWYMHNPEFVMENEHMQTSLGFWNHLISAKPRDLEIVNKKKKENLPNCGPQKG